jgi:IMP cyclohydrolase
VAKATIKAQFPDGHVKPSYVEMLKFAFELGLEASDIDSIYQEYTEKMRAVFIKVKKEEMATEIVNKTFEHNFKFESGVSVQVQLSEANGNLKYVRIFNLISEVEDVHIENALREYGQVKKYVREKFAASLEVDILTGVRGVYLEMEKPLPPFMSIGNLRAKFFYLGMSEGCFNCSSTDHQRKDCPKRLTPFSRAQQQQQTQQQQISGFSGKPLLLSTIVQHSFDERSFPTINVRPANDESLVLTKPATGTTLSVFDEKNKNSQTNTTDDDEEEMNSVDETEMETEQVSDGATGDMQRATRRDGKLKFKKRSGAANSNNARVTRSVFKKAKNDIIELISKTNEN